MGKCCTGNHSPKQEIAADIPVGSDPFTLPQPITNPAELTELYYPEWHLPGPFINHLPELLNAVSEGDDQAAYLLGTNLQHCYNAPDTNDALESRLSEAYSYSDSGQAVARLHTQFDYCNGVTRAMRNQFVNYLELAAQQGNVFAQHTIAKIQPAVYMTVSGGDALSRDAFIAARDAFKSRQIHYLELASEHGSLPAIEMLARAHNDQTAGPNGLLQAYALNHLILALSDDNDTYNRYQWFQDRLYTRLRDEERAEAYTLAEKWLQVIYQHGTIVKSTGVN